MSGDGPEVGGHRPLPPVSYTQITATDAERQSMCRLQKAVATRMTEHAEHAQAWGDTTERNHFGDSIRAAMRLGRDKDAGDTDGG